MYIYLQYVHITPNALGRTILLYLSIHLVLFIRLDECLLQPLK